jgi:hypothetical protein
MWVIVAVLLLCTCAQAAPGDADVEKKKIESLISTVENLKDAKFVRNGTEYDCKAAAQHMRDKWEYAGSKVKTARDFISVIASKSSQSGKPYVIRFKDGKEVESGKYLTEQLEKLESRCK